MASDFAAPSFSLGLDLDSDKEKETINATPPPESASHLDEDDDIERFSSEEDEWVKRRHERAFKAKKSTPNTEGLVNLRNSLFVPRETGRQRVFAESGQAGYWFTDRDGKKVYVSKNGQSLTGQLAYRQYLRESRIAAGKGKMKAATRKVIHSSTQFDASSNLEVPLRSRGILSSQSPSKSKTKVLPTYNTSTQGNSLTVGKMDPFPSLTISPLRKLNLFESCPSFSVGFGDEGSGNREQALSETVDNVIEQPEDCPVLTQLRPMIAQSTPSVPKHANMNTDIENIPSQEFADSDGPSSSKIRGSAKKGESVQFQSDGFLNELSSKEKNITKVSTSAMVEKSTSALDHSCDEYFKSSKSSAPTECSSGLIDPECSIKVFDSMFKRKSGGESFVQEDGRMKKLVRNGLPPSIFYGIGNQRQHLPRRQFDSGTGLSQSNSNKKNGSSGSTTGVKQRKLGGTFEAKEYAQNAEEWINPRNSFTLPRDAVKRRVFAESSQSGYWFTSRDGGKVYMSKNGKELRGQLAYRQYILDGGKRGEKKAATSKGRRN